MTIAAVVAVVAGVVTLSRRHRDWALAVGGVATASAAVAVLLTALLPQS